MKKILFILAAISLISIDGYSAVDDKRWSSRPPIGTNLRYGNPITAGLVDAFYFQEGNGGLIVSMTNKRTFSRTGTASIWTNTAYGPAFNGDGTTLNWRSDRNKNLGLGNRFTIVALVYPTNLSTRNGIFSTTLNNVNGQWIEVGNGNSITASLALARPGVFVAISSTNSITANRWNHIAAVQNGAGIASTLYINGVRQTSLVLSSPSTFVDVSDQHAIGDRGPAFSEFFNGQIAYVLVYNRALTDNDIKQLYIDPWAIFQSPPSWSSWIAPVGDMAIPSIRGMFINGGKTRISGGKTIIK